MVKEDETTSEKLKPIKIFFGSTFIRSGTKSEKYIIINPGGTNTCDVAAVDEKDGKEILIPCGGVDRNFIGEMLKETWKLKRVKKAIMINLGVALLPIELGGYLKNNSNKNGRWFS